MLSPLSLYKEAAKKFNVTEEKSVNPRQRIAFVTAQAQEQKAIINRLLYDVAKARHDLEAAQDETVKAAYSKKLGDYEDDLRQLTKTLDFSLELEKELQGELGEQAGDSPA